VPVSFTINEFYSQNQLSLVTEQIEKAVECDIDAFIVSDIGLIYKLKKENWNKTKVYLSTSANTFNIETAKFYREFGISRIILPRQLRIEEMKDFIKELADLEFEVLILNDKCPFIGGFCSFQHGVLEFQKAKFFKIVNNKFLLNIVDLLMHNNIAKSLRNYVIRKILRNTLACCSRYNIQPRYLSSQYKNNFRNIRINNYFFNPKIFLYSCGICALYDLNKIGIKFIKIAGRYFHKDDKIENVHFIKEAIRLLDCNLSKEEYFCKAKQLYQKFFGFGCSGEYCYYQLS